MTSHRNLLVCLAVLLAGATLVGYLPAYQAGFVNLDDGDYVQKNEHVNHGLRAGDVQWAFTSSHSANWHPLTWISHMADVQLFGLDARGHHAVNVALHAVNVVLLFLLLTWMTGQTAPSFVVAALFALHPVNVESVAWISQRKTTLSTLFGILAIWSYAWYARAGGGKAYVLSLALFALSLMSKQMLVTLPFALLLLDYWPLERAQLDPGKGRLPTLGTLLQGWWRLFPEKVPYLALAIASSCVTLVTQQRAMNSVENYPIAMRLGNVVVSYASYLVSLVWPAKLAVFYPLYDDEITAGKVALSLALLLAITALCCWAGRSRRYLLVGWLWYLGTMVPVIGLVQVGSQSLADRYAYIPFWGLFIALVWAGYDLVTFAHRQLQAKGIGPQLVAGLLVGALLVGCGWLTFRQAAYWHDTRTLFEHALASTSRNWLAHRSLAEQYLDAEDYDQAIEQCQEAFKYNTDMDECLNIYGIALYKSGAPSQAVEALQQAIKYSPDRLLGYSNLGWVYNNTGKFADAIAQFAAASKILTGRESSYQRRTLYASWAYALAHLDRLPEASEKYEQALEIDPESVDVLCDASEIDLRLDQLPRAIERLERANKLDSKSARAAYLLGRAYQAAGKPVEARDQFARAVKRAPEHVDAAQALAELLARQGLFDVARNQLDGSLQAVKAAGKKDAPQAISRIQAQLGDLDMIQKNAASAIDHYNEALTQWPGNYPAANNLAWVLATSPNDALRDGRRAVELAERACRLLEQPTTGSLGTLAAAQAANGDMTAAIASARQGIELAAKAGDKEAVASLERKLRLFQQGKPFIDGP